MTLIRPRRISRHHFVCMSGPTSPGGIAAACGASSLTATMAAANNTTTPGTARPPLTVGAVL